MSQVQARLFWESADADRWRAALAAYPAVIVAQGVAELVQLDTWYRTELPAVLAQRSPAWLEPDELLGIVRWKMRRGEWRPRNLALVRANEPDQVRRCSERAFAAVPDPRRPLVELAALAGVGPATASAVLAAYRPDLYPFLDDRVGAAIPELGVPSFTLAYYVRYAAALRERARELGPDWTAQAVGLALWAASGGKQDG